MDNVVLLLSLVSVCLLLETAVVWASPTKSDTNEMGQSRYTPGYLLSLGQSLNSPLLKLIGLTLCNVKPSPCSDWSQWSQCSERTLGMFGIRNRTRVCGHKDWGCRKESMKTAEEETERRLCEAFCPTDYNLTQHGFCLKYLETIMNHAMAVKLCQENGAHVVNINSKNKLDDIKSTFKMRNMWVDGTRASSASPWEYTYGEGPPSMDWASGEPSVTDLCMRYGTGLKRYAVPCTHVYRVVCEKVTPV